jgi:elongation factor P--(R)-beta-lysine ligase
MSASLRELLAARAGLLARVRAFFAARGVLEVTTPSLSRAATTDPALASLAVAVASLGGRHFLSTSPEFAMKRLLAAGSGDIYEIARVYRDDEIGRWHQPEFLLLEWYRVGFDERALMDEVFELLAAVLGERYPRLGRLNLGYGETFASDFGVDPHGLDAAGAKRLAAALAGRGVEVPAGLSARALLDLALATVIVPSWPAATAVFLCDYPVAQAALAEIKAGDPAVAARFEVFVDGIELGNGFRELTDAVEQRRRFEADLAVRRARGLPEPPIDEAFLAALARGLPPCAGIALGLDRLLALATGAGSLAGTIGSEG